MIMIMLTIIGWWRVHATKNIEIAKCGLLLLTAATFGRIDWNFAYRQWTFALSIGQLCDCRQNGEDEKCRSSWMSNEHFELPLAVDDDEDGYGDWVVLPLKAALKFELPIWAVCVADKLRSDGRPTDFNKQLPKHTLRLASTPSTPDHLAKCQSSSSSIERRVFDQAALMRTRDQPVSLVFTRFRFYIWNVCSSTVELEPHRDLHQLHLTWSMMILHLL